MGIRNFFTQLLRKKEPEQEHISLDAIESWFDSIILEKEKKCNIELEKIRKDIEKEKERTRKNLTLLLETKPKNADLPAKALHFLEGNRKTYPQKVQLFIKDIEIPEKIEHILEFCTSFEEKLEVFGKNTAKNYSILKDLLGQEAANVATNIKTFSQLVTKTKNIVINSNVQGLLHIKKTITDMHQKIQRKKDLNKEIIQQQQKLEEKEKEIQEKEESCEKKEKGEEYGQYLTLIDTKKNITSSLKNHNNTLLHSFSILETALKKYERLSINQNLVQDYLNSPVKTIKNDLNLEIIEILQKMKKSILGGSVELKDKKKEKSLKEIEKLDQSYLNQYLEKMRKIETEQKEIIEKIEHATIFLELEDLKQDIQNNKIRLTETKHKLSKMQEEESIIQIEIILQKLEKSINKELKKNIKINQS